ncbi:MAG: M36 family metallopeptidase, partial [Limisphaerales bacterium]
GTPRFVSSKDGFLTGKNGSGRSLPERGPRAVDPDEAHRVTKAFLREYRDLFGHGPEALNSAQVTRNFSTRHNGLRTTVWQQELDGIPVFESLLIAHLTKDNELVSLSSRFLADPVKAADREAKKKTGLQSQLPVSASRAIVLAAQDIEEEILESEIRPLGSIPGQTRKQRFKATGLPGEVYTGLVWLPVNADEMRLCWQVVLSRHAHGEMFLVLVDAVNGEVMVRRGLTKNLSSATYLIFNAESPMPMSPGHASPSTDQPALITRELITLTALNTNASPLGWITEGVNETIGNNVEAQLDRNGDNLPDSRPQGSPFRVFDPPLDLTASPSTYGDAAAVNLFYWCNWMHDKLYELGFTEESGNFQYDNFGRGGLQGDPVLADAQANFTNPNARNTATFSTPPDGIPGRMQMFIYSRANSGPDRDPSFDAHIILHEYAHGLSDRLVGGGTGMHSLQSRGLAEGWSDFYALALLTDPTNDVHASYPFAPYVSQKLFSPEQNYYFGARRYPYSTDLNKNPLTFKDIDPHQIGSYAWV